MKPMTTLEKSDFYCIVFVDRRLNTVKKVTVDGLLVFVENEYGMYGRILSSSS
jgi:hypothetical protein